MVAVVDKNELTIFSDPERHQILVMLVQKSLHDVATVQAPESVKRSKSEYAKRK